METAITISSILNAPAERIWALLGQVETLRRIAKPYAYFTPLGEMTTWRQGAKYRLTLNVFGFIPVGLHQIQVVKWDKASWSIETHESDRLVKVWNHSIRLEPLPDGRTVYTDIVRIDAGKLTVPVKLWSILFYRHRQRKWKKLLGGIPGKAGVK